MNTTFRTPRTHEEESALAIFQTIADSAKEHFQPPNAKEEEKVEIRIVDCKKYRSGFAGTEVFNIELLFKVGNYEAQRISTSGAITGYAPTTGFSLLGYCCWCEGIALYSPMPGVPTPEETQVEENNPHFKKRYICRYVCRF